MHFLDLPDPCLEQIFLYLSYDSIAKCRLICRRVDQLNQGLLNRGFVRMTRRHANNLKAIKSQLPRRESERRNHPLAKHSDILTCIETRLSMLAMTYTKYMDLDLCCFIPGRVIDEVLSILKIVEKTTTPLRAHEVLQELRDISSMATDHFDDEIAPLLKQRYISEQSTASGHSTSSREHSFSYMDRSISEKLVGMPDPVQHAKCEGGCSMAQTNRTTILKIDNSYKQALRKARAMCQIQAKQMLQLKNYSVEMNQMKSQMTELKKRLEEYEVKNREMAATISQMKSENPDVATSAVATTRNIKPRTATIILKRRIDEPVYSALGEAILKKSRSDQT